MSVTVFAPLSQPMFAQVKYPIAKFQHWSWHPPAIFSAVWIPDVVGDPFWIRASQDGSAWTVSASGAQTWTPK